jgi:hypothetical protein
MFVSFEEFLESDDLEDFIPESDDLVDSEDLVEDWEDPVEDWDDCLDWDALPAASPAAG